VLGSSFNSTQPVFVIRAGANTVGAIGTSEPVGLYVDEVYVPRFSSADFELFDLESVEVLRGPQGTFFGRNVAAGAIVIKTARPSLDGFTGKVQASYGNYNAYEVRGMVNGPLSDTVAAKVSISRVERDGYGVDRLTGQELDDLESTSVRASVLWRPSDAFEALLSADYTSDSNSGRTLSSTLGASDDGDRRTAELGVPQGFDRKIYGGSLRLTYSGEMGDLIAISGLRASESEEDYSWVPANYAFVSAFQRIANDVEEPQVFSQELRFVSADLGGFDFIAGAFYLSEDSSRIVHQQQLQGGTGELNSDLVFDQTIKTEALAGFIDATAHLGETLDLSAGVRYTHENRKAILDFSDAFNLARDFIATEDDLSEDFNVVTPRVAITYMPLEHLTVYATYSRGFTAGGFFTEADSFAEVATPFQEETIDSFELGVKMTTVDGRGYLNVAGFLQDYKDKQEFVFNRDTFQGTVLNAADASIKGVEVELGYRFSEYFRLDANLGILHATFDDFVADSQTDYTGNPLGNAPDYQAAIIGSANYPILNGDMELFANVSWSITDDYFTGGTADPDLFVEGYDLVNANVGVRSMDGRWTAELYGTNLFDTEYRLIPSDFGFATGEHLGAPRMYGARVTYSF
jgi:iron complex outermembrane receptor protein